jgi:hypothetical protein
MICSYILNPISYFFEIKRKIKNQNYYRASSSIKGFIYKISQESLLIRHYWRNTFHTLHKIKIYHKHKVLKCFLAILFNFLKVLLLKHTLFICLWKFKGWFLRFHENLWTLMPLNLWGTQYSLLLAIFNNFFKYLLRHLNLLLNLVTWWNTWYIDCSLSWSFSFQVLFYKIWLVSIWGQFFLPFQKQIITIF